MSLLIRALEETLEEEGNFNHPDFKENLMEILEHVGLRLSFSNAETTLDASDFFDRLEKHERKRHRLGRTMEGKRNARARSEHGRLSTTSKSTRPITALSFASSASFTSSFSRRRVQLSRVTVKSLAKDVLNKWRGL